MLFCLFARCQDKNGEGSVGMNDCAKNAAHFRLESLGVFCLKVQGPGCVFELRALEGCLERPKTIARSS